MSNFWMSEVIGRRLVILEDVVCHGFKHLEDNAPMLDGIVPLTVNRKFKCSENIVFPPSIITTNELNVKTVYPKLYSRAQVMRLTKELDKKDIEACNFINSCVPDLLCKYMLYLSKILYINPCKEQSYECLFKFAPNYQ